MIAGGGNPTGEFTGAAETLEIVGNRCYAYSGVVTINNVEGTQLLFKNGTRHLQVDILFSSGSTDKQFLHKVYFNDIIVQQFTSWVGGGRRHFPIRLIVPSYTEVKCTSANITDNVSSEQVCSLTGKVYRN